MELHTREWGRGETLIALHPLALESSAFEGLAVSLAKRGKRTVAIDLPGFGRTPAPRGPLTPAVLAAPVVEFAQGLDPPPMILGVSLGARVALEAVLRAPEAFRSAIVISPYLPWKRRRQLLGYARYIDPERAEKLPIERIWPLLRGLAEGVQRIPYVRDDAILRAGVRLIYYASCPATRASILSAARELALEPAFGPEGFWPRLATLRVPTAFVWGEKDRLVPYAFAPHVLRTLPHALHRVVRCCGHAPYGAHDRCLVHAVESALGELEATAAPPGAAPGASSVNPQGFVPAPCLVGLS
ncbi:MAG: alpha/beta fold hydrolase [Myxococcota bacterium]